jgi:hypothetical protein
MSPEQVFGSILALLLTVGSVGLALMLKRPALEKERGQFMKDTLFAAACLGAMATGIAFGVGALAGLVEPGCQTPAIGWHGCRPEETRDGMLVLAAGVTILFLVVSVAWRLHRDWKAQRADAPSSQGDA